MLLAKPVKTSLALPNVLQEDIYNARNNRENADQWWRQKDRNCN
jgi:hypothetical protein